MEDIDGDIREQAALYLKGEVTGEAFEEWFVAATWDDRTPLRAKVDHLLAQRSVIGEEFDRELEELISVVWIDSLGPVSSSGLVTIVPEEPYEVIRTRTITKPLSLASADK